MRTTSRIQISMTFISQHFTCTSVIFSRENIGMKRTSTQTISNQQDEKYCTTYYYGEQFGTNILGSFQTNRTQKCTQSSPIQLLSVVVTPQRNGPKWLWNGCVLVRSLLCTDLGMVGDQGSRLGSSLRSPLPLIGMSAACQASRPFHDTACETCEAFYSCRLCSVQ